MNELVRHSRSDKARVSWSTLAQVWACRMFGTKLFLEPNLNLHLKLNHSMKFKSNYQVSYKNMNFTISSANCQPIIRHL